MQAFVYSRLVIRSIAALTLVITMALIVSCGAPTQSPEANVPSTPIIVEDVTAVAEVAPPPIQTGIVYWPTSSPPTLTASASMTVIPAPTEVTGLQETIVAQATASPYPTAQQPVIQQGEPYVVSVRRGVLYYELRLAGDNYLAGENGQALITLRNDGKDTLFLEDSKLTMLDEQGREPGPFPTGAWFPYAWFPGGYMESSRALPEGKVMTETLYFQLPPAEESNGHIYSLSASTGFSKPMPTHPDRGDRLLVPIETGPVPLKVSIPRTDQYLKAEWQADDKGYRLRATDPAGKPVENAWGALVASANMGLIATPMRESRDGSWSDVWPDNLELPIRVEAWLGARGYVATTFKETVGKPGP